MFVLRSHITIETTSGQTIKFSGVNDMRIRHSVKSYINTAFFKIPTSARLKQGTTITNNVELSAKFNRGDKITIQLGYNDKMFREFVGFISNVNFTTPLEIECEGYSFQLRNKIVNKTFAKGSTLRSVLEELVKGTDITLSNAIPQIKLSTALVVPNKSAAQVLDHIKDTLKLTTYFREKELYCGLESTENLTNVVYRLGWNTIRDGGLRYKHADQTRVKVVLKTLEKEGGKTIYTCGDADGEIHEHVVHLAEKESLKTLGENFLKKLKYTGYEGTLTAFLQPNCQHGWSADIQDKKYPEREGKYFVVSVEVIYYTGGARRIVELSYKLS